MVNFKAGTIPMTSTCILKYSASEWQLVMSFVILFIQHRGLLNLATSFSDVWR